ncbi:hypothetical protein SANA_20840 [Gottschalkiaceae bacterium SANA]|nr:hypothetical protein SANA_20840 [Gottschalkiaceae bacterium SANA]
MKKMLLLNGSPRREKTSYRFAQAIEKQAINRGIEVEINHIFDFFNSPQKLAEVVKKMEDVDYLGLVTPLYVDYLPYPVLWFMEECIKQDIHVKAGAKFFAVAQCGFPDERLLDPILGACEIFAKKMKREWAGGIGYGGGAILDGIPMEELGKRGVAITHAFSMMMEDLLNNEEFRDEIYSEMRVQIPRLLYRPLAFYLNHRSKQIARKNGVRDLWVQPYKG